MGIIYHKGVPYASGTINEETPYGTSAPSGGSDGDLYIQIDNNGNIVKVWQNHNNTWGYLSGGGSEVIPNPQDEPTDTLNTVEIDGTVYDIEGGGGSNLIIDAQKYSLEEEVVGIWTDGKPLYQKTIEVTSITRSAWNSYLVDVDAVIKNIDGWYKDANNTLPLNYFNGSVMMVRTSDHADGYFSLYGSGTLATATVTVQYTKTTDTAGSGGFQAYGFTPIIYSDVEREVGVWRDNKPLYQKTFYFATPIQVQANRYETLVTSSGLNIETIVSGEALPSKEATFTPVSLTYTQNGDIQGYFSTAWSISYLTIRYTKTTDVAGSGEYNTLAIPNVHYSTEEQVIGTWIDGKPIYQKTFTSVNIEITNANTWYDTGLSASGIANFIDGKMMDKYNYQFFPVCVAFGSSHTKIVVSCPMGNREVENLTIQYTKTTDA